VGLKCETQWSCEHGKWDNLLAFVTVLKFTLILQ
jgi:hypothetical protein